MSSSKQGAAAHGGRVAFLDQMRTLAIVPVVICHYYSPWLPGGGIGVGIFFALSGYLITTILLRTPNFGPRAAFAFIVRRFTRIYPAYLAAIAAALYLSSKVAPEHAQAIFNALPRLLTLTDVPNSWTGYSTGVLWTLHVEFAFYVTIPIAMLIAGKERGVLIAAAGLIIYALFSQWLSRVITIGNLGENGGGGALALGALLAYAAHSKTRLPRGFPVFGVAVAGLVILMLVPPLTPLVWKYEILASSGLACLLIASSLENPQLQLLPGTEIIGVVSYSIYLVHGLVIDYGYSVFDIHVSAFDGHLRHAVATFGVTVLAISILSYLLIERPGIAIGSLLTKRKGHLSWEPRSTPSAKLGVALDHVGESTPVV
jgi:peptidoglycan/LPS O-acetylase OafA/YrhL